VSTLIVEDKLIERKSQKIKLKNNFAYKFIFSSSFDLSESTKFDLEYSYHDYGRTKSALDSKQNTKPNGQNALSFSLDKVWPKVWRINIIDRLNK